MTKYHRCDEVFEDKSSFCSVDGAPFDEASAASMGREFNLTLISEAYLTQRLVSEVQFVLNQIRKVWPTFKRHPIVFIGIQLSELRSFVIRSATRPHVFPGLAAAVLLVLTMILSVLMLEKHSPSTAVAFAADDVSLIEILDFHSDEKPHTEKGVGAGDRGRVGFNHGRGEGSRPVPSQSGGGGAGGDHNQALPSQGRLPQPSSISAPIPTAFARLPLPALPDAGIDIDPALWSKLSYASYGDPRSKSTVPSNGPGDGGGVGATNGTGIGDGIGPGFGPGKNGNMGGGDKSIGGGGESGGPGGNNPDDDANRVYSSPQVTSRPRVLSKPEPQYTEEARRTQITGTVILRVVFSRSGQVSNIRPMQSLGGGLTEKAIVAARQIRFVPATRNGRPVSMYMQLEYNFNLY